MTDGELLPKLEKDEAKPDSQKSHELSAEDEIEEDVLLDSPIEIAINDGRLPKHLWLFQDRVEYTTTEADEVAEESFPLRSIKAVTVTDKGFDIELGHKILVHYCGMIEGQKWVQNVQELMETCAKENTDQEDFAEVIVAPVVGSSAIPTLRALSGQPESSFTPLALGPSTTFVLPEGMDIHGYPQITKPCCGLVWMHGLGDTEQGWANGLQEGFPIAETLGPCSFLLPRAPTQNVTSSGGKQLTSWFDFQKLPLKATDTPLTQYASVVQALASCGRVHSAIDKLIEQGIPPQRIVVGGFSQGGAMALLSALTYRENLAGVIVFSGVFFIADVLAKLPRRNLDIFWGHGLSDKTLDFSLQQEGVERLRDFGYHVVSKQYSCGHTAIPGELADAAVFFADVIGPMPPPCP